LRRYRRSSIARPKALHFARGYHRGPPPAARRNARDVSSCRRPRYRHDRVRARQAASGLDKTFVTEFSNGAYLYQLQEVSAVGDGNQQIAPIQKIVRAPADIHRNTDIAFREGGDTAQYGDLIPFCLDQNANEWCFVGNSSPPSAEYEVAYFDTAGRKLYGRLPSFTAWLERLIETQDEVIRTLYDEDVLYDDLNLG